MTATVKDAGCYLYLCVLADTGLTAGTSVAMVHFYGRADVLNW